MHILVNTILEVGGLLLPPSPKGGRQLAPSISPGGGGKGEDQCDDRYNDLCQSSVSSGFTPFRGRGRTYVSIVVQKQPLTIKPVYIINSTFEMADDKTVYEQRSDDLDLVTLAERIISFCKKYGRLIVICALTGALAGFLLYMVLPKRYSSTLLLHSFTLTNTEYINIIDNWNQLLKKKEYEALSQELSCEPSILEKVSSIKAFEIQKLYIQNNPNGFMVEAVVADTGILDELQKGIVTGLENGEYLKAKLESRKANLRQLIEKVKSEITKLDSTKRNIESSILGNSGNASYIIDITGITGQMIGLNEKLLGYQEDLRFTRAVQVLHNFAKFKRPFSPQLFKLTVLGFIGGFVIGYLLAVYTYIRGKIEQRHAPIKS